MFVKPVTAIQVSVKCLFVLSLSFLVGCFHGNGNSDSLTSPDTPPEVTIDSISVTPQTAKMADGTSIQFSAEATLTDGSQRDVTEEATWSSSDDAIAMVANAGDGSGAPAGQVLGVDPGTVTISAAFDGVTGSTGQDAVEVTSAVLTEIQVTPTAPDIPAGTTRQFTATGIFSDGSNQNLSDQVNWSSSNEAAATVDSSGLVSGVAEGNATVTAELDGISDISTVTVVSAVISSVQVEPGSASAPAGRTQQFTATGIFTDGEARDITADATWQSADTGIATVDQNGLATGVAAGGPVNITASFGGKSDAAAFVVTDAVLTGIQVEPDSAATPVGTSEQFTATGFYSNGDTATVTNDVTWVSSDSAVATIDATGLAEGIAVGSVVITATLGELSDTADLEVVAVALERIDVSPVSASIANGTSQQFEATGIYNDGSQDVITEDVTWTSSNRDVADIGNAAGSKGFAIAKSEGIVDISASLDGIVGQADLEVTAAELNAIQVSPNGKKLSNGFQRQYTATGFFTDGSNQDITEQVTWASNNVDIATVSNVEGSRGLATADETETGTVVISAAKSGETGNATLTVVNATLDSIDVTPVSTQTPLDPDSRVQFVATGSFNDGGSTYSQNITDQVTWSSSDSAIASVSNVEGSEGEVTPVSVGGPVQITATSGAINDFGDIEITDATLESITVTPVAITVAVGEQDNFTATGNYSDNSSADITDSVTWASDNPDVTVTTGGDEAGTATVAKDAISGQTATITASMDGVTSSEATLQITDAVLVSIAVDTDPPGEDSTAAGNSVQFTATGTYSDDSSRTITDQVSWTVQNEAPATADENVADINNSSGNEGLLNTFNPGTVEIVATDTVSDTASDAYGFTVTDATVVSLVVDPPNPDIARNTQQRFSAIAEFTDGSTSTVTSDSEWSSSVESVATINNTDDKGLATSPPEGTSGITTITAIFTDGAGNAVEGSTELTVNPASLTGIVISAVNGAPLVVPEGYELQLVATGTFSDGSTQVLTDQVTWSSFFNFAIVSNAGGSEGLAAGVSAGEETIAAALDDIVGSATLEVTSESLVSIDVTPKNVAVDPGDTQQYQAMGIFSGGAEVDITTSDRLTWASSNELVATISAEGLATARTPGDTDISATAEGVSGSTNLHVDLGLQ